MTTTEEEITLTEALAEAGVETEDELVDLLSDSDEDEIVFAGRVVTVRELREKYTVTLELITPLKARMWLTRNTPRNRKVKQRKVEEWAQAMRAGEWRLNNNAVAFDADGNLIDSQHRLLAVVRSGVSIVMFVVRGLDEDAKFTIDIGAKRTGGDQQHMLGRANGNHLNAIARLFLDYEANALRPRRKLATQGAVNAWIDENDAEAQAAILKGRELHTRLGPITISTAATAYMMMRRAQPGLVDEFWNQLCLGEGLTKTDAVYALREKVRKQLAWKNKGDKDRAPDQVEWLVFLVKTWNAWRTNNPLSATGYRWLESERFPEPV